MLDFLKETKAVLYDRVGDKFFRTFATLSIAYNWKLFSSSIRMLVSDKTQDFLFYQDIVNSFSYSDLLHPLYGTILYISLYPWFRMLVVYYSEWVEMKIINAKNRAKRVKLLSEDEKNELYKELDRARTYYNNRESFEQQYRKIKDVFGEYYNKIIYDTLNVYDSRSNGKNSIFELKDSLKPGDFACVEQDKLISIATAEADEIELTLNNVVFIIYTFDRVAFAARFDSIFVMSRDINIDFKKEIRDEKVYYITEVSSSSKLVAEILKFQKNVYKLSFRNAT